MKMFRVSKEIVSVLLKKKTPFLQTPNKAFVNFAMQRFSTINEKKIEKIHELKFNDNFSQIAAHRGSLILDFHATWCGPCKKLYPILKQKAASSEQKWNLLYINIDEFPDIAESYQVQAVPTVVLLQDGKIVDRFVGMPAEDKLTAFLQKANSYK